VRHNLTCFQGFQFIILSTLVGCERAKEPGVDFQELKSLFVGIVLICGVMLVGPLTTHASPSDPFARPAALARTGTPNVAKPRVWISERIGAMLSGPRVRRETLDLSVTSDRDFGDWEPPQPQR
jgi:hypothetical protein